ncbi:hypothetical protein BDV96DRAFT_652027 [Lophiotrema nucula]|uniref:Uncharacterized protein n=1 Tax=Lophiotrema nucula TaxID=690887 RepID=A0A6A5YSW9_9PLEO|nr:hypothetical protein BDV96DRAFT_652027 [Lophiotrema nucula]
MLSKQEESDTPVSGPLIPRAAFDESEHIRYYRRLLVLQRLRKRSWHNAISQRDPILEHEPYEGPKRRSEEQPQETSYHNMETLESLYGHKGVTHLDLCSFDQLREMDEDDDIELEFSRSLYLDSIKQQEYGFRRLTSYLAESNFAKAQGYAHFLKSLCYTVGVRKAGKTMEQIQFTDLESFSTVEDTKARFEERANYSRRTSHS